MAPSIGAQVTFGFDMVNKWGRGVSLLAIVSDEIILPRFTNKPCRPVNSIAICARSSGSSAGSSPVSTTEENLDGYIFQVIVISLSESVLFDLHGFEVPWSGCGPRFAEPGSCSAGWLAHWKCRSVLSRNYKEYGYYYAQAYDQSKMLR
ncbi:hypothetical protein SDJN02_14643, partial [Cucurbita argyrosperma subsp. argyrosperma]